MSTDTQAPAGAAGKPGRNVMILLMSIAFLNMVGIGIILPVLPFVVQRYVTDPNQLVNAMAWLASSYAICQFVAAPILGALSDRYGRRPILLICLIGSAIGYALFGIGGALWVLFLARIVDGLTGGNFSVLASYIADLVAPQERGRYFGIFGAIAGAGFIIGPALGGLVSRYGVDMPVYLTAAITVLALIWTAVSLPESLPVEQRAPHVSLGGFNVFKPLADACALPQLRWLLLATFLFSLPFAMLQSNLSVLVIERLGWSADALGMLFLVIGGIDIVMQGLLAARLLPIFGEINLTIAGLACEIVAYVLLGLLGLIASPVYLFAGIAMFSIGSGFLEPASRGLLSQLAGPQQQGLVQGGNQSAQSLALVLGPLLGGIMYTRIAPVAPYWVGAVLVGLAIIAVRLAVPALQIYRAQSDAVVSEAGE